MGPALFFEMEIAESEVSLFERRYLMEIIKNKKGQIKYREMLWINGMLFKSPRFHRKTDAIQWKANQLSKKSSVLLHGDTKFLEKITLAEFSKRWLATKVSQNVAKSTYKNYESNIRTIFLPYFKSKALQVITKTEIESLQTELLKKHNPKGVNTIVINLKSIFKEAMKEGYIIKSPCEFVKSVKTDARPEVFWTKSEIDQFLKSAYGDPLYELYLTAMNTGMRRGELSGLCWDRVDFSANSISVTRTRDRNELKERTKTNLIRVIPMNDLVRMTLLNLFKNRTDSSFVFMDQRKQPINPHHLYRSFERAQNHAGLTRKIRFHDLRHTFASQYIINGGSIYDLQKFLGHTDIAMTTRYAHHSMDYLQSAMKGFCLGSVQNEKNENEEKLISLGFNLNLTRSAL